MGSSGKLRSLAERHRLGSDVALAAGLLALSVGSLTAGLGGMGYALAVDAIAGLAKA